MKDILKKAIVLFIRLLNPCFKLEFVPNALKYKK